MRLYGSDFDQLEINYSMHSSLHKSSKGFTLIEVIVSVFVFLIVMTAVTNTFTNGFSSYKNTKIAQKNLEDVQFAMNLIAKELRTSTIVAPASNDTVQTIRFYDYSQSSCLEYEINSLSKELKVTKKPIATPSTPAVDCGGGSLGTAKSLVKVGSASGALLTGNFRVTPSVAGATAGKVTIALQIQESGTQVARIQTSVSLRDYGVSF